MSHGHDGSVCHFDSLTVVPHLYAVQAVVLLKGDSEMMNAASIRKQHLDALDQRFSTGGSQIRFDWVRGFVGLSLFFLFFFPP